MNDDVNVTTGQKALFARRVRLMGTEAAFGFGSRILEVEKADGERVHYLDVSDAFLGEDGTLSQEIMPDYLHLSEKGYQLWAEAMEPSLKALGI